jgi:hypothetical protein
MGHGPANLPLRKMSTARGIGPLRAARLRRARWRGLGAHVFGTSKALQESRFGAGDGFRLVANAAPTDVPEVDPILLLILMQRLNPWARPSGALAGGLNCFPDYQSMTRLPPSHRWD